MGQESINLGYFVSGLAIMSTITSLAIFTRSYLPNVQMKVLDDLLHETRQIYDKSVSSDLLPGDSKIVLGGTLAGHENECELLREQAYRAISIFNQYIALVGGLSLKIMKLSDGVLQLRAEVVTTSEQVKRHREEERSVSNTDNDLSTRPSVQAGEHTAYCDNELTNANSQMLEVVDQIPVPSARRGLNFTWLGILLSFVRPVNPISDPESIVAPVSIAYQRVAACIKPGSTCTLN